MAGIAYAVITAVLLALLIVYGAAALLLASWRAGGRRVWWLVAVTALTLALDVAFLRALPALHISYGPAREPWLMFALLRGVLLLLAIGAAWVWARKRAARLALAALALGHVLVFAWAVDIFAVEPHDLRATRLTFRYPDLPADFRPLRIAHLTDTHVERGTRREAAGVEQVNAFQPDLILLTGDYLNLSYLGDETARRDFRRLVSQLHAPLGMYATGGSVDDLDLPTLFEGTPSVVLHNQVRTVDWPGAPVHLIGVTCEHNPAVDVPSLDRALAAVPNDGGLRILLYHSPELAAAARNRGLHLYLAGHTHGGRVCLPFYGPLFSFPMYSRAYAAGVFPLDDDGCGWMIVSRGIGMESWVATRVRWLCPPEVVLITISQALADQAPFVVQ